MIDKVAGLLTNPSLVNLAQNTQKCIVTESLFKAAGRPMFIMMDDSVDKDTRKYAATKECLYQLLCLGIYLTLVSRLIKNGGFKLAQKILKEEKTIPPFKNVYEYDAYYSLAKMKKEERRNHPLLKKLSDLKENTDAKTTLKENLLTQDHPKLYEAAKGAVELSSLVGSVVGLAWFASEISNKILHPIMRTIGLEKAPTKGIK